MKQVLIVAGLLLGPAAVAVAQQPTTPTKPVTTAGLSLSDALAAARGRNPPHRQGPQKPGPPAGGGRRADSGRVLPPGLASGGGGVHGPPGASLPSLRV